MAGRIAVRVTLLALLGVLFGSSASPALAQRNTATFAGIVAENLTNRTAIQTSMTPRTSAR